MKVAEPCGPFPEAKALLLDVTSTQGSGIEGALLMWPYDVYATPSNIGRLRFNGNPVSNEIIIETCDPSTATAGDCTFDISLSPHYRNTNVYLDVLGYFTVLPAPEPTASAVMTCQVESVSAGLGAGSSFDLSVTCPSGTVRTGGGVKSTTPAGAIELRDSSPGEPTVINGWKCRGGNDSTASQTISCRQESPARQDHRSPGNRFHPNIEELRASDRAETKSGPRLRDIPQEIFSILT